MCQYRFIVFLRCGCIYIDNNEFRPCDSASRMACSCPFLTDNGIFLLDDKECRAHQGLPELEHFWEFSRARRLGQEPQPCENQRSQNESDRTDADKRSMTQAIKTKTSNDAEEERWRKDNLLSQLVERVLWSRACRPNPTLLGQPKPHEPIDWKPIFEERTMGIKLCTLSYKGLQGSRHHSLPVLGHRTLENS